MLFLMLLSAVKRKTIDKVEVASAAKQLAGRIEKPHPDTVVYIRKGGEAFGLAIAKALGIPSIEIDIGYPLSRTFNSSTRAIRAIAWPVKELVYKIAKPALRSKLDTPKDLGRVLLVDDSASSGRSIEIALKALEAGGVDRSLVKVAVFRCGPGAESVVDYFETRRRVLFDRL